MSAKITGTLSVGLAVLVNVGLCAEPDLFVSVQTQPLSELEEAPAVRLNEALLGPRGLGAPTLRFHTFHAAHPSGTIWKVEIRRHLRRASDSYTVVGVPAHDPSSYLLLSYEQGAVDLQFHGSTEGVHFLHAEAIDQPVPLVQADSSSVGACGGGLRLADFGPDRTVTQPQSLSLEVEPLTSGVVTVDVAVVYTADARAGAGNASLIHAAIENALAQANQAFSNSDVNIDLRLVYRGEVNYVETGDVALDLMRLTYADGYLDEVQCIRDHYGADLVALITESANFGGIAWILCEPNNPNPDGGFSVVQREGLPWHFLAHEWGHNFGCDHEHGNPSGCRAHSYSYGFKFTQTIPRRTIMAYPPGDQVAHFSNPDVDFFGVSTGVNHLADNARTLRETAHIIAAFRPTASPQPPPSPANVKAVPVQTNAVRITWIGCGADGYVVHRDGAPISVVTGSTFTDSDLTPGDTHCWAVTATNMHGASVLSADSCVTLPHQPPFVLDGQPDFESYLQSDPGMTIYAAVRDTQLYVATWSPGHYPDDDSKNDHFIFVTDALLPAATEPAPWAKTGTVAVDLSVKPYLGAESRTDFVGWFNATPSQPPYKWPVNDGKMEGVIDLVEAFGHMPSNLYVAAVAYGTDDGDGLVARAPAGSGPNVDPDEFLPLYIVAIKDEAGDGLYDRLDPTRDFVTHEISRPAGDSLVRWASVPGRTYQVDYADTPASPWHPATTLTAGVHDIFLSWTDPGPAATTRVYRVLLTP